MQYHTSLALMQSKLLVINEYYFRELLNFANGKENIRISIHLIFQILQFYFRCDRSDWCRKITEIRTAGLRRLHLHQRDHSLLGVHRSSGTRLYDVT